MICRKIIVSLIISCIASTCIYADDDTKKLECECRKLLKKNIKEDTLISMNTLTEVIRGRGKYLKEAKYKNLRSCYEELQFKIGNYYFTEKRDLRKAPFHFEEAYTYSKKAGHGEKFGASLLARLDSLMSAGGKNSDDLREVTKTKQKYGNYFRKESKWEEHITFLEKYYKVENKKDYPKLLALFDKSQKLLNSYNSILIKWGVMSKADLQKKCFVYYEEQVKIALRSNVPKDESDFIALEKALNVLKGEWDRDLIVECHERYNALKAYFNAGNRNKRKAAKNLYIKYPELAKSYSIPRPPISLFTKTKKTNYSSERVRLQSKPSNNPIEDFKKLEKMWKTVKKMNTEQEVVSYIRDKAPLHIKGSKTARKTLCELYSWHRNWSDLGSNNNERLKALRMIAEMQSFADNPEEQKEIYKKHVLDKYNSKKLKIWDDIYDIIGNNKVYLDIYEAWEKDWKLKARKLWKCDNDLNYKLLTLEQEIQAHYILGLKNKAIPGNELYVCYHMGRAYQLMDYYNIEKIYLSRRKKVIIKKDDHIGEMVCEYCSQVNKDEKIKQEFEEQFKDRDVNIDSLLLLGKCPRDSSEPES